MMAVSEESAALLLVVAVLTGTCASGADAQFDITNLCNRTIAVSTGASNVIVESGTTITTRKWGVQQHCKRCS
jgi:hypothetical protein